MRLLESDVGHAMRPSWAAAGRRATSIGEAMISAHEIARMNKGDGAAEGVTTCFIGFLAQRELCARIGMGYFPIRFFPHRNLSFGSIASSRFSATNLTSSNMHQDTKHYNQIPLQHANAKPNSPIHSGSPDLPPRPHRGRSPAPPPPPAKPTALISVSVSRGRYNLPSSSTIVAIEIYNL